MGLSLPLAGDGDAQVSNPCPGSVDYKLTPLGIRKARCNASLSSVGRRPLPTAATGVSGVWESDGDKSLLKAITYSKDNLVQSTLIIQFGQGADQSHALPFPSSPSLLRGPLTTVVNPQDDFLRALGVSLITTPFLTLISIPQLQRGISMGYFASQPRKVLSAGRGHPQSNFPHHST